MPIQLNDLLNETVTRTLYIGNDSLTVAFAPARYTGEMDDLAAEYADEESADKVAIADLRAAGDLDGADKLTRQVNRRTEKRVRELLAELIVSWDLMDGEVEFPHDVAHLRKLHNAFLMRVFIALGEENQPDPPKARGSDATSSPKRASSARSRRGTRSSGARTTSVSRRGK